MQIVNRYNQTSPAPTFVALGSFDGLHLGHQAVIKTATTRADLIPTVFSVLPDRPTEQLLQQSHRQALLEQMGVALWYPTSLKEIAHMTAEEFFQTVLIDTLQAKAVVCGFNFRFGQGAKGDTHLLQRLCDEYGISLTVIPPVTYGRQPVSSSRIRQALQQGDLTAATAMLGRKFSFTATVQSGQHLGQKLGFPTVNQPLPAQLVCPKWGVYAVTVAYQDQAWGGVCNVGVHPTVGALSVPIAETHLFDCHADLYDKELTLTFQAFLREERTFADQRELQQAIAHDLQQAKAILLQ